MENNPSPQQAPPVAPVGPSEPLNNQQPTVIGPVKKKPNKGLIIVIIVGAVVLVGAIIALAVALPSILAKDNKQEYQEAINAALDVSDGYSSYANTGLARASLNFQFSMERLDTSLYNIESLQSGGQARAYGPINSEALAKVEAEERSAAESIAKKEAELDRRMEAIDDEETIAAYQSYKDALLKLYGEGRSAQDRAEVFIHVNRIDYGCAEFMKGELAFVVPTVDSAKKFVMYAETCMTALQGAMDSEATDDQLKEFSKVLHDMFSEAVAILRPQIASGDVDMNALDVLEDRYGEKIAALDLGDENQGSQGEVEDKLYELTSLMATKRDSAPGEYVPAPDEGTGSTQPGIRR